MVTHATCADTHGRAVLVQRPPCVPPSPALAIALPRRSQPAGVSFSFLSGQPHALSLCTVMPHQARLPWALQLDMRACALAFLAAVEHSADRRQPTSQRPQQQGGVADSGYPLAQYGAVGTSLDTLGEPFDFFGALVRLALVACPARPSVAIMETPDSSDQRTSRRRPAPRAWTAAAQVRSTRCI